MSPERAPVNLPEEALLSRTRRSLITGVAAIAAGVTGYEWLRHAQDADGMPLPQRRILNGNGRLWHSYLSDGHLAPIYAKNDVRPLKPNGNLGLTDPVGSWQLHVSGAGPSKLTLGLNDIQTLPRHELITRFCCIEGWSTVVQWAGARFSDFTQKYVAPGRSVPPYIYMGTPDDGYYVGLDRKSALHPQTLLAYEMNGLPLTPEHGAPLRLVIPIKYGIKNIKRIGSIQYVDRRPDDYWAQEGYDWFAGL